MSINAKIIAALAIAGIVTAALLTHDQAWACGMTTHSEVCQRAVHAFASDEHPEYEARAEAMQVALQPGAVFPDWGYAFGYQDESEAAHWSPFIDAAADYVRGTYPKPWDDETWMLAVFLLGITSHSVSDAAWHALGIDEGFLDAMGGQDFHGSFEDAHEHGDFGGDVVCAYELDLSYKADVWYVPSVDMARVYNDLGHDRVTPGAIEGCMGLMFLAYHAEDAGWMLFPTYAKGSPFLVEELHDYFAGGLDDMAARTSDEWASVIDRLENGAASENAGPGTRPEGRDIDVEQHLNAALDMLADGEWDLHVERTDRGAYLILDRAPSSPRTESQSRELPPDVDATIDFTMDKPYGYLGASLAHGDFNADGIDDLAIGAPGYGEHGAPQMGAVFLIYGRPEVEGQQSLDLLDSGADLTLEGDVAHGRFGWALASVDMNADGRDDLAISAPTASTDGAEYSGRIEVFLGGAQGLQGAAGVTVAADQEYTNLGWTLGRGDINGDGFDDLLVGAPYAGAGGAQRGLAAAFLSSLDMQGAGLSLEDADWIQQGENDYDWFGRSLYFAPRSRFLLVGATAVNSGDVQSAGRLYAYSFDDSEASLRFTITGVEEFDRTGSSAVVADPYRAGQDFLLFASPGADSGDIEQAGSIVIAPMDGLSGDLRADQLDARTIFRGGEAFGRLGWSLAVGDVNHDGVDDLLAGEPWRGRESGAAYVWLGGPGFPSGLGLNPEDSAFWSLRGLEEKSLFSSSIDLLDFNADGSNDIVLGSRRSSDSDRQSGLATLIITPAPPPAVLMPDQDDDQADDEDKGGNAGCCGR